MKALHYTLTINCRYSKSGQSPNCVQFIYFRLVSSFIWNENISITIFMNRPEVGEIFIMKYILRTHLDLCDMLPRVQSVPEHYMEYLKQLRKLHNFNFDPELANSPWIKFILKCDDQTSKLKVCVSFGLKQLFHTYRSLTSILWTQSGGLFLFVRKKPIYKAKLSKLTPGMKGVPIILTSCNSKTISWVLSSTKNLYHLSSGLHFTAILIFPLSCCAECSFWL